VPRTDGVGEEVVGAAASGRGVGLFLGDADEGESPRGTARSGVSSTERSPTVTANAPAAVAVWGADDS
jgi:hypothetical protein